MAVQFAKKIGPFLKRNYAGLPFRAAQILTICLMILILADAQVCGQEEVSLVVNELRVFPVHNLRRVAVGDPAVADITVLSEGEIMLIAKATGATSLIIWDEAGQHSFNITVIEKDLEKVARRIEGFFASSGIEGLRVKAEEDKVYIIGETLTAYELNKIKDIVAPFGNIVNLVNIKERQPLVEIDVNVLEIAYDDEKNLGLDWSSLLPVTYTEPTSNGPRTPGTVYDPKIHTTGKFPKLWRVFKWDRSTINAKLNFLIENDQARTLANPKLVTISGKEASFLVGGEVPYVVVETEGRTSVQWKDYGVTLTINPLVNAKNEIRTQIKTEVTDLDWANAATQQSSEIPALKKREAQTELFLNEGDTVFLAGLIKNEDSRNIDRLPWMSKVPILGELFKSTLFQDKRTELVISLSPRIISEEAVAENIPWDDDIPRAEYISQEVLRQETALAAQPPLPDYSEESSPLIYYGQMIEDIIAHAVAYPAEAQEEQFEGIVKIALLLSSDGQLKEVAINESSGSNVLDKATLDAAQKAAPYPSFPSEITQKELRLILPIVFKNYVQR